MTKTEAARLNKNAFFKKIETFKRDGAIMEIQKSGIIDENLNEIASMYCRGIDEIKMFFSEVIGDD